MRIVATVEAPYLVISDTENRTKEGVSYKIWDPGPCFVQKRELICVFRTVNTSELSIRIKKRSVFTT